MDRDTELEHRIRERAYALWEAEGRPDGKREAHWNEAWREIAAAEPHAGTPPPPPDDYRPGREDPADPARPGKTVARPAGHAVEDGTGRPAPPHRADDPQD